MVGDPGEGRRLADRLTQCAPHLTVETAASEAEAVEKLTGAASEFDVVVCDLQLSGLDGVALIDRVREQGLDLAFIFLIPANGAAAAQTALREGASDFLFQGTQTGPELALRVGLAIERQRGARAGGESTPADRTRGSATSLENDKQLKMALAAGQLSLWAWDLGTQVTHFSGHWKTPLGYADDEIDHNGADWEVHCHPADLIRIKELTTQYLIKPWPGFTSEFRMRHKDGSWHWFLLRADLESDGAGHPVRMIGWYIDITDLKQQQAELTRSSVSLQKLSRRLLEVQETERRHLARELHDEIGQVLTAAKIQFESTSLHPAAGPIAARCRAAAALLDRLLAQVRSLSLDLRPPLLDDLGLMAALRWLVEQQQARVRTPRVHLESGPAFERCDPAIEIACYRVAQEALTNALRHARAHSISILLAREDGALRLSVRDDGIGFDPEAARARAERGGSLGLLSMHERISLTGGTLELRSSSGHGTRISAVFPLTVSPLSL
jgi:PAS domain S-box-containing protein